MHVLHHRLVDELALVEFLLATLDGSVERNLEGMLTLYIPMLLLNWILENIVDLIELLRCQ